LHKVLPPVVVMFGMGLPTKILCNFLWPMGEPSRWLKLAILVAVGLFYVALCLLILNIFQKRFFSSDERQKISSLPIPGAFGGIWKRLWRTA
jgi:hypothetical protein